jgi:hypothetical protein
MTARFDFSGSSSGVTCYIYPIVELEHIYRYFYNLVKLTLVSAKTPHVRWVPCHHGMARAQVANGGDALQFWRAPANILNKQSQTADKGWFSSLGVGRGANNCSP